jgi:hypothetical protein
MFDKDKLYETYGIQPSKILVTKFGSRQEATQEDVIDALYLFDKDAANFLGMSSQTLRRYVKELFPDIDLRSMANRSWESLFLTFTNVKRCSRCRELVNRELFSKDKYTPDGLKHECKNCVRNNTTLKPEYAERWSEYNKIRYQENLEYNRKWRRDYYQRNKDKYFANSAKRRAAQLQAIPLWADLNKIEEIYLNKPKGYNVDHIIPLQGDCVCGLHVENNLQYLTESENKSKGNKLLPEFSC